MPTITVPRALFFETLGKTYTTAEFDELCFEYGIELDEDTTLDPTHEGEHNLKIEVTANRYDLLCLEGIARSLNIFNRRLEAPKYQVLPWGGVEVKVLKSVSSVRPFMAGAVLRDVDLGTEAKYKSFMDLQDKLHGNMARGRKLVAIGTHDMDSFPPGLITYEGLPPKEIQFVPLNKSTSYNAEQLMTVYESEDHIRPYLPIIRDSPVYPIIYDSTREVLSMPPIINSERTKITLKTKNVFVDMTATDETKLETAMQILVSMFSEYCAKPFTVEPVKIVYEDGKEYFSPNLSPKTFTLHRSYVNASLGLSLSRPQIQEYLARMAYSSELSTSSEDELTVFVPPTRPDVLHECDILEDVAVAYGVNELPRTFPKTNTVGRRNGGEKLSDVVRRECASGGWIEGKPLVLCSLDENFAWLRQTKQDGVVVANPKSQETQSVRTSLLPGLLKTLRENRDLPLPTRVFEVGDVVLLGESDGTVGSKEDGSEWVGKGTGCRNVRRAAAVYRGLKGAGFEVVQGLVERVLLILGVKRLNLKERTENKDLEGYWMEGVDDPTFFPGRSAHLILRQKGEVKVIGKLGILHPEVLSNFDLATPKPWPVSVVEWNLDVFL